MRLKRLFCWFALFVVVLPALSTGAELSAAPEDGGPRGYVAAEFLRPAIAPYGAVATGPDDSALRAGQGDFDARGKLPCAQSVGQPTHECQFGVTRAGGGYVSLVVTHPIGRKQAIFFRAGIPVGTDTSEADGYHESRALKEGDLHFIRVGPEHYEVVDSEYRGLGGIPSGQPEKRMADCRGPGDCRQLLDCRTIWKLQADCWNGSYGPGTCKLKAHLPANACKDELAMHTFRAMAPGYLVDVAIESAPIATGDAGAIN